MYDEKLLERNLHPENWGVLEGADYDEVLVNESCGDEIRIMLKIKDGVVVDGAWEGRACAIASVSADIFIEKVQGKKVEEVGKMRWEEVEELSSVRNMPGRVKCAELAWNHWDFSLKKRKVPVKREKE
ncbi:MAG: iron-sulfur cluster assembly scaffold protein [Candidatus Saccharibacteria bacterium]|nr:iron-sulfur cluster assembly scaffold protein [Candidatus Saccharibacteria bacterium]